MWRIEYCIPTEKPTVQWKDFVLTTQAIEFYKVVKGLGLKPLIFSIETTNMGIEDMEKFLASSRLEQVVESVS